MINGYTAEHERAIQIATDRGWKTCGFSRFVFILGMLRIVYKNDDIYRRVARAAFQSIGASTPNIRSIIRAMCDAADRARAPLGQAVIDWLDDCDQGCPDDPPTLKQQGMVASIRAGGDRCTRALGRFFGKDGAAEYLGEEFCSVNPDAWTCSFTDDMIPEVFAFEVSSTNRLSLNKLSSYFYMIDGEFYPALFLDVIEYETRTRSLVLHDTGLAYRSMICANVTGSSPWLDYKPFSVESTSQDDFLLAKRLARVHDDHHLSILRTVELEEQNHA